MPEIEKVPCPLDRVPDRVTEVQQGPFAFGLAFVRGHNGRFDPDISPDERREILAIELLEHLKHLRVADDSVLDDLRESLFPLSRLAGWRAHPHRRSPARDDATHRSCFFPQPYLPRFSRPWSCRLARARSSASARREFHDDKSPRQIPRGRPPLRRRGPRRTTNDPGPLRSSDGKSLRPLLASSIFLPVER